MLGSMLGSMLGIERGETGPDRPVGGFGMPATVT